MKSITLLIAILAIVAAVQSYGCVEYNRDSYQFCGEVFNQTDYMVYDAVFTQYYQSDKDDLSQRMYMDFFDMNNATEECRFALKAVLCQYYSQRCYTYPTALAYLPCMSMCQNATMLCDPNVIRISSFADSFCTTSSNCNDGLPVEPATNCTRCNHNGDCTADGECICNGNYDESTFCFTCKNGFYGDNCELHECSWDTSKFGAPTPIFSPTWDNAGITFVVTMAYDPRVEHFITFDRLTLQDLGMNMTNLIEYEEESNGCARKYSLFIPWTHERVIRQVYNYQNNMMLTAKIYATYYNTENQTMFSFEVKQEVFADLTSESTAVVTTEKGDILRFKTNSIYQENNVITVGAVLDIMQGFSLRALRIANSNNPSPLNVYYYSTSQSSLRYAVSLTSQPGVTDITGSYVFEATMSYQNVLSKYTFTIDIEYKVLLPSPPINLKFMTAVSVTGANGVPKSTFAFNDRVYVKATLTDPAPTLSDNQALKLRNAYVCCMKDGLPMPTYDPSRGLYGCTVNNPSTMDKWIALVVNRTPNSIARLEQSANKNSAAFSFDISPLSDKARTCYIHTSSVVSVYGRSLHAEDDEDVSVNFSAFAVQSTTVSAAHTNLSRSNLLAVAVLLLCVLFL